ncbi:MAG: hypothetical protein OEY77_10440 [Nitrospira sp.]|nr:hypothetical protein [Nitrospira sp.]
MLTIVARPDPSLTPIGSELVPLRTRVHLSYGRAQRVVQACSQQAAVFVGWLHRKSWRATELGWGTAKILGNGVSSMLQGVSTTAHALREGTTKAVGWVRPQPPVSEERLQIAAAPALEAVTREPDLVHEVRMLRAQVQAQNKILAELTYVLLEDRKRVRESDQLVEHHDRQTERRLLRVLQTNSGAEENWGNTKSTTAHVAAD